MNEKIKYYNYSDYHKIANSLLKQLGMFEITKLPLDIELIIDKSNINIISYKNLKKDYGVKGLVIKKINGYDIGIDYDHYMDDKQELYYRFTLAEELSHIILHSNIFNEANNIGSIVKIIQNLTDEEYRKIEQQARVLAGCILLPANIFDDYVIKYVETDLENIKKYKFFEKDELSFHIADKIHKNLNLSLQIVYHIINNRYPNLLIDKILDKFGTYTLLG